MKKTEGRGRITVTEIQRGSYPSMALYDRTSEIQGFLVPQMQSNTFTRVLDRVGHLLNDPIDVALSTDGFADNLQVGDMTLNSIIHTKAYGSLYSGYVSIKAPDGQDRRVPVRTGGESWSRLLGDFKVDYTVNYTEDEWVGHPGVKCSLESCLTYPDGHKDYGCDIYFIQMRPDQSWIEADTYMFNWIPVVTGKHVNNVGAGWTIVASQGNDSPVIARASAELQYAQEKHSAHDTGQWKYTECYKANVCNAPYSADSLVADVKSKLPSAEMGYFWFKKYLEFWSYLAHRAIQSIGLNNSNGLAYAKDTAAMAASCGAFLVDVKGAIAKALKRSQDIRRVNGLAKRMANEYLGVHYGTKLQYRDTLEYLDTLKHLKPALYYQMSESAAQSSFTTDSGWFVTQRYHFLFNPHVNEEQLLTEFLKQLDLTPSFENAWDMVPYSFVIDWFTHFSDILNALDNMYHVQSQYRIIGSGRSIRATKQLTASDLPLPGGFHGAVSMSYYARMYSKTYWQPLPSGVYSKPQHFNHYVEAGALIVQRLL